MFELVFVFVVFMTALWCASSSSRVGPSCAFVLPLRFRLRHLQNVLTLTTALSLTTHDRRPLHLQTDRYGAQAAAHWSAGRRKTRHSILTSTSATPASTQQRGLRPPVQRTDHPRQPGRSQFQNAQLDLRHVPSGAHC